MESHFGSLRRVAKTASIINFKGGVGKTTLALHFAAWLARRRGAQERVLLVDVDHQSSLSIVCMDSSRWEDAATRGDTVNKVFASFMTRSLPGAGLIHRAPFGDSYPTLDLLPAQLELDNTEIKLGATTIGDAIDSEWTKRTLLCQWLDVSGTFDKYDYVIFDCPPATKLVSQNALAASQHYILPVIPEAVSTRGVTHFRNLVASSIDKLLGRYAASVSPHLRWKSFAPTTDFGGIVISKAQPHGPASSGYLAEHTQQMGELRRLYSGDVLEYTIDRYIGVAESLTAGWPVFDQTDNPNVSNQQLPYMFSRVCSELAERLNW